MTYAWQLEQWPEFTYTDVDSTEILVKHGEKTGYLEGLMKGLKEELRLETLIELYVQESLKTSEIEGEYLNRADVYSSIKKNLGLIPPKSKVTDKRAQGIADLIQILHKTYMEPLSEEVLFKWHKTLMLGNTRINTGKWRFHNEPMQVVSGSIGKEIVHYEAPPSNQVPQEMQQFINWFNATAPGNKSAIKNPIIRSAIAHLYFETIHPFEDGNGRIGRFISEKALSQGQGAPVIMSLSNIIEQNKKEYYNTLKKAQRTLDWSSWINYFAEVVIAAQNDAAKQIEFTLKKALFFEAFSLKLNGRQQKVLNKMFDTGYKGFEGGMNAKKYMSITKTSKATATRDLQQLFELGALTRTGAGRSVHYDLGLK